MSRKAVGIAWFGLAFALLGIFIAATPTQDQETGDLRITRVYLKNGAVLEAESVREGSRSVVLVLASGEVTVRRDAIDRMERVKRARPAPAPARPEALLPPRRPEARSSSEQGASANFERIESVLEALLTAPEARRNDLFRELLKLAPSSIPYLVRRLETVDDALRSYLAAAIVEVKDAASVRALQPLLRSRKASVRAEVARLLGALGDPAALPWIAALLGDEVPAVRSAALQGLAGLPGAESFRAIASACSDPVRDVRLRALQILPALSEKLDRREGLDAALMDAFDRTRGEARADIVAVMGITGRKEQARFLALSLRDDSPVVRSAIVTALVNLRAFEWQDLLLDQFFREEDPAVRIALAWAAQSLKLSAAIDALIAWLSGPDRNVSLAASRALKALTEKDFGLDEAAWRAWWAATKPK
ncbi:MAG: HEAT repeat domain-containing protein [Planctomycetes bacterium]|nr:HEAT repeat domain-containing protein [Planctomycetota bacterium]